MSMLWLITTLRSRMGVGFIKLFVALLLVLTSGLNAEAGGGRPPVDVFLFGKTPVVKSATSVQFILENSGKRKIYIYCGVENYLGGEWRGVAYDAFGDGRAKGALIVELEPGKSVKKKFDPAKTVERAIVEFSNGKPFRLDCDAFFSLADIGHNGMKVYSPFFSIDP